MAWLRRNARAFGALALVAMTLQIVGTFGHFHRTDTGAKVAAVAVKALSEKASVAADVGAPPSGGDSDAACPLCLVGNLVAAGVTAAPPALVLPIAYLLLGPPQPTAPPRHVDVRTSFWSRGPPVS